MNNFMGLVMANGGIEIVGQAQRVDLNCYGTTLPGTDIKIFDGKPKRNQTIRFSAVC